MEKGGKDDDSIIQAQMSSKGEDFVFKAHGRIALTEALPGIVPHNGKNKPKCTFSQIIEKK